MNIGTPLTSNATRVALCGSGELGKEVVIELQRYGCEIIAIDRYENAPAMQVAHRSYNIDMLDADELRSVLEKEKPSAVKNIDSIIEESDGIMIARGDLGVEMAIEQIPAVQKKIIRSKN